MSCRQALFLLIVAEAAIIALALINYGNSIEALQAITRYSGRLSLLIFSIIFLSRKEGFKASDWLSENYFLIFAIGHGIHLIELISYQYYAGGTLNPVRTSGGFIAYLIIFLMPWIEMRWKESNMTSKTFTRIEWFYLLYIWVIFFLTYLPRVMHKMPHVGGSYKEHLILLLWVCLLPAVKLQSYLFRQRTGK